MNNIPGILFALGVLALIVAGVMSAKAYKAVDEDGKPIPEVLVRCVDIVEMEPEECNLIGPGAAFEFPDKCSVAGIIRLCGQFFPADVKAH